MPTRITKVSDSNFFAEDIIKISQMSEMERHEGGSVSYDETIAALTNKAEANRKSNPNGPLLSEEDANSLASAHYNQIYNRLRDRGEPHQSAHHKANFQKSQIKRNYTAVLQDKYNLDHVAGAIADISSSLALGFPVIGKAVAGYNIGENVLQLSTYLVSQVKSFAKNNKENSEIFTKPTADPFRQVSKQIHNDEFLKKHHKSIFSLEVVASRVINIIINGIAMAIPGPGGATVNVAIKAAKNTFQSAILGNVNGLLNLIKTLLSGNLSTKIPSILKQILTLIKEPLRQLLSQKTSQPAKA